MNGEQTALFAAAENSNDDWLALTPAGFFNGPKQFGSQSELGKARCVHV